MQPPAGRFSQRAGRQRGAPAGAPLETSDQPPVAASPSTATAAAAGGVGGWTPQQGAASVGALRAARPRGGSRVYPYLAAPLGAALGPHTGPPSWGPPAGAPFGHGSSLPTDDLGGAPSEAPSDQQYCRPLYHLASRLSPEELRDLLLLQCKLQQQQSTPQSAAAAAAAVRGGGAGGGVGEAVDGHGRRVLRLLPLKGRGWWAEDSEGGGGGGPLGPPGGGPMLVSRGNRKRKRTAARLDRLHALRCLHCGRIDGAGSKFGDYVICAACGASDFAVGGELGSDAMAAAAAAAAAAMDKAAGAANESA